MTPECDTLTLDWNRCLHSIQKGEKSRRNSWSHTHSSLAEDKGSKGWKPWEEEATDKRRLSSWVTIWKLPPVRIVQWLGSQSQQLHYSNILSLWALVGFLTYWEVGLDASESSFWEICFLILSKEKQTSGTCLFSFWVVLEKQYGEWLTHQLCLGSNPA